MKKYSKTTFFTAILLVFILTLFSKKTCYSKSPFIGIKKNQQSIFLETNYLMYMLGLSYDYTTIIDKKHGWSFSAGISAVDSKSKFIVPPNIGIPMSACYIIGKRQNFLDLGISLRPQFFFTKDYVHHDHFNLRTILEENTNLVYFAPKIGYRYLNNRNLSFKFSVGPQFKLMESDYLKYTGEMFEDFKHLETLNIQISIGFILN